jgi:hypothetical protein
MYRVELCCVESIEICESLITNVYNLVDMFQALSFIYFVFIHAYIYFRSSPVGTSSQ